MPAENNERNNLRIAITPPVAWALACAGEKYDGYWSNMNEVQQAIAERFAMGMGWMDDDRSLSMVGCLAVDQIKEDYERAR